MATNYKKNILSICSASHCSKRRGLNQSLHQNPNLNSNLNSNLKARLHNHDVL